MADKIKVYRVKRMGKNDASLRNTTGQTESFSVVYWKGRKKTK